MAAVPRLPQLAAAWLILALVATLVACTPVMPEPEPADAPVAQQPSDPCPVPGDGQLLLRNETHGYCLLYPAEYTVVQNNPDVADLVIGDVMNHTDPRLSVAVSQAEGKTLAEITTQFETNYAPPGFEIVSQAISVAGEEAILLDNLPGQDLNRRMAFLHQGKLYSLFITPLGDEGSDTRRQAEALNQLALESFSFLE